jgi:hypothetical protein
MEANTVVWSGLIGLNLELEVLCFVLRLLSSTSSNFLHSVIAFTFAWMGVDGVVYVMALVAGLTWRHAAVRNGCCTIVKGWNMRLTRL